MQTIIADVEFIVSGEELWVSTPTIPVWDFQDVRRHLPAEFKDHELSRYIPIAGEPGQSFRDGWVLRPATGHRPVVVA